MDEFLRAGSQMWQVTNMKTLNRQVVIVRPKAKFLAWVNNLPEYADQIGPVACGDVRNDCTAFLVSDDLTDDQIRAFIEKNHNEIFEEELFGWCTDSSAWPKITLARFREWFDIEFHSIVIDLGKSRLRLDEY